jgi:hypothetical protein
MDSDDLPIIADSTDTPATIIAVLVQIAQVMLIAMIQYSAMVKKPARMEMFFWFASLSRSQLCLS